MHAIHTMGNYWQADADEPTALGSLIAAAKDLADVGARRQLERELAGFAVTLDLPEGCLVVAVPPGPDREAHPVPALAAAVGAALGAEVESILSRRNPTAQLRDTPPDQRPAMVVAGGYTVVGDVRGRSVVLIDDVILTGATIEHLAQLLGAAGAARVDAVVAARTRPAGSVGARNLPGGDR